MNIGLEKIVKTEITARRGLQVSALRAGVDRVDYIRSIDRVVAQLRKKRGGHHIKI